MSNADTIFLAFLTQSQGQGLAAAAADAVTHTLTHS